ncbi:endonuclease/exonuclease/phosphatase family protein [Bacillus sp. J14TS2]|uniref:endonuclease/exonuclease/phosphatase family protein n=1 Tax=Bacillus sp. J14TS2 TaxID=2807188 RepID=UPI001BB35F7B|nr:endonuclease/exonuclease/phosphatase family protein [Bacillus sp. J14TS2]
MKKMLGLFLSIIMIFFITGQASAQGYGKEVDVKVMSFNIHHGAGLDNILDLQRTAQVIKGAGAEIVGIQEVDRFYSSRSDFQDQAKELAEILGYHYVYGANLDRSPAEGQVENRQYGTAVLSKYPIIDSENIYLDSFGNEQRGLLRTKINVRGIHVNFYNTHLGLSVGERVSQVREIIDISSSSEGPNVLVGDLNAESHSEEFQLLLNEGNFVDVFDGQDNANTFPVKNPNKRIDYILTSPSVEASNQEVIYTEASDHLPVVSKLIFKR